jgi:hypothetical protein
MLEGYSVKYNPSTLITDKTIMGSTDHIQASNVLTRSLMPHTLLDVTSKSVHYRDAIIAHISNNADNEHKANALNILVEAIQSTPDGDPMLQGYSEYAAAIALLLDSTDVASKIIARNERSSASSFLTTLATVIARKIETAQFKGMVEASGAAATQQWVMVDRPTLFPND